MTRHRIGTRLTPLTLLVAFAGCESVGPTGPAAAVDRVMAEASGSQVAAPTGATAVASSETTIDLTWQDRSTNETRFEVHRATTASGTFTLVATTPANVSTYRNLGLVAGTQHCYKVRAVRIISPHRSLFSAFSNTACATTPVPPPPPPPPPAPVAPSGATTRPSSSSSVTLAWTDNSSNEDLFRIDRSTDEGMVWHLYGTAGANVTRADQLPAVAEQRICYRVVAVNAGGEAASNAACTSPPAGPTNMAVSRLDPSTIAASWSDNSAVEDGYQVRLFQANCIGACNAFDPLCELYGICPRTLLIAALPANTTSYTGSSPGGDGYLYEILYVVAMKDGGNSDASDPRVPLDPLEP
jgi:hypothetical protein